MKVTVTFRHLEPDEEVRLYAEEKAGKLDVKKRGKNKGKIDVLEEKNLEYIKYRSFLLEKEVIICGKDPFKKERKNGRPVNYLAAKRQAWLVALAMGENGIPDSVEERLAACELIITHLAQLGVGAEQVFFDPLVLPIAVDASQGLVTLKTIEEIKARYPASRTVMGLSNISYGLPNRKLVNRAFLLMAAYAGLDAVILDPRDTKAMSLIKTADMLTGKDPSCRDYLRAHRRGTIVD